MGRSTGLVSDDDGWRIPDWLWSRIAPLISPPPVHPLGCGRRRVPDRVIMNAILLVLRTGMQWNALDATGVANSKTAHRRFQECERAGCSLRSGARGCWTTTSRSGSIGRGWLSTRR
jgi:transposase